MSKLRKSAPLLGASVLLLAICIGLVFTGQLRLTSELPMPKLLTEKQAIEQMLTNVRGQMDKLNKRLEAQPNTHSAK